MPVYQVDLEPIDPLLFGDNRSARAGVDHLQLDQDPSPLTLHGAIGRFIVEGSRRAGERDWPAEVLGERQKDILDPEGDVAELLGYCFRGVGGGRFFPRPRHLRCAQHGGALAPVDLLAPAEAAGTPSSVRPRWPELPCPAGGVEDLVNEFEGECLVSEGALGDVLSGELPVGGVGRPEGIYRAEPRPGIAVDNLGGTVIEGRFFTRPYRRFRPARLDADVSGGAGFSAWWRTLAPWNADPAHSIGFLGGDRRRARFTVEPIGEREDEVLDELRRQVEEAAREECRGFLLYLLTPAVETGEAVRVAGQGARAAALGKELRVSGWDAKLGRPRPLRALVPAGSVFFFGWPAGVEPAAVVRDRWLKPLRPSGAAAGFGRCLVGVWR